MLLENFKFMKRYDPHFVTGIVKLFNLVEQTHLVKKCFGSTTDMNIEDLNIHSWYLIPQYLSDTIERIGEYVLYDDQSESCWWGVNR